MRWQKIARVTVAAIGLAGAVAIYYYSRSRSAPADPPKSLAKLDSNVVQTADDCHMILLRAKGNVKIHMCGEDGKLKQTFTLDELLPASFGPENLA